MPFPNGVAAARIGVDKRLRFREVEEVICTLRVVHRIAGY